MLASILGAPLLGSVGCDSARGAPAVTGELRGPSMEAGHRLRDPRALAALGRAEAEPRRVRVAILGAGPAGLAAAWRLMQRGVDDFEIYELEAEPGGTSVAGKSEVTAYPWGAHYLPTPAADQPDLVALLDEMNVWEDEDRLRPREELLVRAPDERLFYRGFWVPGIFPEVDATARDEEELARFEALCARWAAFRGSDGRRAFDVPSSRCSTDAEALALDAISAAELCARENIRSPKVLWWLEYGTRDDYGLSLEDASAWSLLFYHVSRRHTPGAPSAPFITWPEGNGAIVRHLARGAGRRLQTEQLVVNVTQNDAGAEVLLSHARSGALRRVQAERVICALPRFISARVVEGAKGASDATYGAWMVANLHLRSRPGERGFAPSWDNVIYDSPSLGYVSATHQRGRDHGPSVWTYYLPFTDSDARAGRRRLLEPSWDDWQRAIVADLGRAHPDLPQHLERLDVWRWGHAMVQPRVGVRASVARVEAARPLERVHFAHSDLSGLALFEEAFDHGVRAADEVVGALAGRS